MADKKPTKAQREKAWLEARRQHITATDLAPIMGIPGSFGSPLEVWQEKKGLLEKKNTEQQEAGLALEPAILGLYANRHGDLMRYEREIFVAEEYPVLAASLDARHLLESGVLGIPVDAKNVRRRDPEEWGDDGSADFPARYVVQLHAQMIVTGQPAARLAVLFSGHDFGWFHVERDPDIVAGCLEAAEEFWTRFVLADVPPPVDGTAAWSRWLASRRRKLQIDLAPGSPEDGLAIQLRDAYHVVEKAEERKAELANRLKEFMGENEVALTSAGRISFAFSRDGETVDHEAYAAVLEGRVLELDPGAKPFLEKARKQFTQKRPGTRSFRPTWRE
jgi:putative phage-type endonuclease